MPLVIKKFMRNFKNSPFLIKRRAIHKLKKGGIFHTGRRCDCGVWRPFVWNKHLGFGITLTCNHAREYESQFKPLDISVLETYLRNTHFQKRWGLIKN